MSSNKHIHGTNGRTGFFQGCSNISVTVSRPFIKRDNFQRDNKLIEGFGVFLPMCALGNSVAQFGEGYEGNTYVADLVLQKTLEHGSRLLLDDLNADIGVKQQFHQKLSRLSNSGWTRSDMKSRENFFKLPKREFHESLRGIK